LRSSNFNVPTNFDPARVGTNVAAARKRASITQDAMARALNISRPTFIAIESGQRAPSALELATIARQLNVSVRELANLESVDAFSALRFRGLRGLDEGQPAVDELEAFGRRYATLERLAGVRVTRREPPIFPIEGLANVERAAEELAAMERLRLGLGDGPLPDLRGLLEEDAGLRIFGLANLGSTRIAGVFAYSSDFGPLVGFNAAHDSRRVRWTLCHEYAHYLSERYEAEVTIDDGGRRNRREQFADAFASRFLMPSSGISRRFSELLNDAGGKMTVAHLVMLAQFFDVSFEAVTRRLEEIGRVGAGTFEMLRKRGFQARKAEKAMGFENRAPADRLPFRYTYLVATLYGRGDISEGDVMDMLRTDRLSARELLLAIENPEGTDAPGFDTPIEVTA
jgi:Zn-dependent peptidase ImmA (M78 family)/DNA-binding XRE family transcriptional regulator